MGRRPVSEVFRKVAAAECEYGLASQMNLNRR